MKEKIAPDRVSYSPFYGLILVFGLLIMLECFNLKQNLTRHELFKSSLAQVEPTVAQANTINVIVESLSRDLLQLAGKSAEAKKIITEFNIRLDGAAPAVATPPAPVEKK